MKPYKHTSSEIKPQVVSPNRQPPTFTGQNVMGKTEKKESPATERKEMKNPKYKEND